MTDPRIADPRPRVFRFRRDLRLDDNPGLAAAAAGGPVIPVFILDGEAEAMGAAAKWRLGRSLVALGERLREAGSRLVLRRGDPADILRALAGETGAEAVHWGRAYARGTAAADEALAAALERDGVSAKGHPGFLLREPWAVETKAGGYFKVFTPFSKAAARGGIADCADAPELRAPETWPGTETLEDWGLGAAMNRGAAVIARYATVGETAARDRLDAFLDGAIRDYVRDRERPDRDGCSGLSENLTYGEISPRRIWHAAERAGQGAEAFRRELLWREFAWHLLWHRPDLGERNWREEWDAFRWRGDNEQAEAWRRGLTGEPMVDAGMRELFVTGRMHNRVRMIVASYLTKNLLTHWRVGLDWFADTLTDWDAASNALNWQWVAGSGPDAAPFFRVFNPRGQAEKFDPDGAYRRRFVAGFDGASGQEARDFFAAVPRSWKLDRDAPRPEPIVDLRESRTRALDAYQAARGGLRRNVHETLHTFAIDAKFSWEQGIGEMQVITNLKGHKDLPPWFAASFEVLKGIELGRLDIALPDGRVFRVEGGEGPTARLDVGHPELFARVAREGELGFCEAYMDGWWDTPDLQALLDVLLSSKNWVKRDHPLALLVRAYQRARHWMNTNTKGQAKKNISYHYDLGNQFYGRWLDETMTYSSAIFEAPQDPLAKAQRRKYASVCDRIGVVPDAELLEIGCGWGGFAEFAAKERGARVRGLTISREQHDFARERMFRQGLNDRVEIVMRDYRDERDSFDGVASIEMFEAVGEKYWPVYFESVRERLRPGAQATLQVITVADSLFPTYRKTVDFIQKYIFPGGMLPSPSALRSEIERAGLRFVGSIEFGESYSETLRRWHATFENAWDEIRPLGFDERFRRMWTLYLTSCAAAFRSGTTDVTQVTMARTA